jgi:predicted Zn-dependent protease
MSRTRATFLLACLAVVMAAILSAAPAKADTYGWKWAKTTISVADLTHSQRTKDAITRWDAVTPLTLDRVGGRTADIVVRWGDLSETGWAGSADWTLTGGVATHCEIVVDRNRLNTRSLRQQYMTSVVLHEVGHCLGLAHTTDLTVASIMDAFIVSNWQYPQPYDIGQLALLYG